MQVKYCDVCKMIIKEEPKKEKTYSEKEQKEYFDSFAMTLLGAYNSKVSQVSENNQPYVCNKEICKVCEASFYKMIEQWERLRFEETKKLFLKQMEKI